MTRDLIAGIERVRDCNGDWSWLLAQLVGSKQLWLRACRQVVARGRGDWLARFLPEQADPHWFLELLTYCNPESPEIASAITACAQVALLFRQVSCGETDLAQATAVAESLYQAAVQWEWAHLLDPGDVGELGERAVCVMRSALGRADPHQQQVEAMVRELKQVHEGWQLAPVRDLILFFLGEEEDAWPRTVRVPIPADLGLDRGSVVTLVLESRAGGLGEFYSDPRSMAFLHADMEFQGAHECAWAYARRWHDTCTDIRWTLSHPSCHFLEVRGASAGTGFALGLTHLLDFSRLPLGREWAITGDITEQGRIQAVNGYHAKLQGARIKGYKVIVPAAALASLLASGDGCRPVMKGVNKVEQASEIVSRRVHTAPQQFPHPSHPVPSPERTHCHPVFYLT